MKDKDKIAFISFTKGGSMYVAYKVNNVVNHIKPGTKPRNELLITGIPAKQVFSFLARQEATIDDLIELMNRKDKEN